MNEDIWNQENVAFLYKWTDHKHGMYYVGYRKGNPDDDYICSSKYMLEEYKKRPEDFTREILLLGERDYVWEMESRYLEAVDAANNPQYYNRINSYPNFIAPKKQSEESNRKRSESHKGKKLSKEEILKRVISVIEGPVDDYGRVCTICNEYKPWKEFHKKAKSPLGHGSNCKACRYIVTSKYRERKTKPLYIGESGRECARCNEYKVWDEFKPKTGGKNGHTSRCIECLKPTPKPKKDMRGRNNHRFGVPMSEEAKAKSSKSHLRTSVDGFGRVCTVCHEYKEWNEFYTSSKGFNNKMAKCKKCFNVETKERRKKSRRN